MKLHSRKRTWILAAGLFSLTMLCAALLHGRGVDAQTEQARQIAPSALAQIAALNNFKQQWTPAQRKIGSRLLLAHARRNNALPANLTSLRTSVATNAVGAPQVDIAVTNRSAVLKKLEALGMRDKDVLAAYGNIIQANVPFDKLETVAGWAEVTHISEHGKFLTSRMNTPAQRPAPPPGAVRARARLAAFKNSLLAALDNTSEGDQTHRAQQGRNAYGVTGAGIKIGVISDGVDTLALRQASGDLGPVTVLPGQAGAGDEGTAMLEIVHDLAPGAQLYFATADPTINQFAQNIRDLRNVYGCHIIVDDIIYLVESPFQDGQSAASPSNGGVVTQAVNDVTASGALYFSSAGNEGNKNDGTSGTWEGDFNDGGVAGGALAGAGNLHNFGAGTSNQVTANAQITSLHWSDPLGASGNDYDIYVLNNTLTTVFDASADVQDGDDDPVEIFGASFTGERIVVAQFSGAARYLSVRAWRGRLSQSTDGSTHGHSSATNAFSVAATPASTGFGVGQPNGPFPNPFTTANVSETFTSDGPRRLFFQANGTPFTPGNVSATGGILRQKPDITAADGVMTAAPGFNPFFGTSAAAPHAAAIAALLLSANPSLTPAQVRTALLSSALDIETAGVDRDTGAGIVMADTALAASGAQPRAYLTQGTVATTITAGDNDTALEPCEAAAFTIPLINVGSVNATAVSATLTASTPGVVIVQGTSAYADIAATNGTQTNLTPYRIIIGCDVACGTLVNFTLTVTYSSSASPQTFNFTLFTGALGTPQTFSYTGQPVPIPDGQGEGEGNGNGNGAGAQVFANLLVNGLPGPVGDVDFRFDGTECTAAEGATTVGLDHTFVNDLQIVLKSPNGTTVTLIDRTDGSGNNFCQTALDDESAGPSIQTVVSGQAPFTGSFKPASLLSAFDAQPGNGTWQLGAQDFFSADTGNIRAFTLTITPLVCSTSACTLTPPSNVTACAPIGSNTAVVNYGGASVAGGCGVVTCSPPSGSAFSVGTTTVTCTPQSGIGVSFTVTVTQPTLSALPGTAQANAPFNQTITATNAVLPVSFVAIGTLPPGLTLSAAGVLSGTPTTIGTYNFSVLATDANQCQGMRSYTLTVTCPTITLSPATAPAPQFISLPTGSQSLAYSTSVAASPAGTYSYAVTTNILPPGLTLNTATGAITGTPSAPNNYAFAITATGAGGCAATQAYNLLILPVCAPVTVSPVNTNLPAGTHGTPYSQQFSASGGVAPYSFSVSNGALPSGLALDANSGLLSGTPTATGLFIFTVKATSVGGCFSTRSYILTINCTTVTITTNLPNVTTGVQYSQTLVASPTGTYTFSLTAGSLPPGLSLDSTTGVLSGKSTVAGSYTFTVRTRTASGCQGTRTYTLGVSP